MRRDWGDCIIDDYSFLNATLVTDGIGVCDFNL